MERLITLLMRLYILRLAEYLMVVRLKALLSRMWERYCEAAMMEWESTGGYGYHNGL